MIQVLLLRAALYYPAERSLTSHRTLFSIPYAALQYKAIVYCFLLSPPDHKKGCLFLIFDLNEKIKVQSVSGIHRHDSEPQCQKWCILPLSQTHVSKIYSQVSAFAWWKAYEVVTRINDKMCTL